MKNSIIFLLFLLTHVNNVYSEPVKFRGMISSHNKVRVDHQQVPLSWSNSLSQYAQQWVNHLASTQNCAMIHRPNQGGGRFEQQYGENLFWASAEKLSNGTNKLQNFSAKDIVKAWAEEEEYYDYQNNLCQPGEDCGHFTQMVWHESRQVGCAMAICPDKSQLWACNYYPRGNYIGEWPY